jgi:hypothetical protein
VASCQTILALSQLLSQTINVYAHPDQCVHAMVQAAAQPHLFSSATFSVNVLNDAAALLSSPSMALLALSDLHRILSEASLVSARLSKSERKQVNAASKKVFFHATWLHDMLFCQGNFERSTTSSNLSSLSLALSAAFHLQTAILEERRQATAAAASVSSLSGAVAPEAAPVKRTETMANAVVIASSALALEGGRKSRAQVDEGVGEDQSSSDEEQPSSGFAALRNRRTNRLKVKQLH